MKYYAVKVGKKTGIYTTWDECLKVVIGYPGAVYKSFTTEREAKEYIGTSTKQSLENNNVDINNSDVAIAYVDGSYAHELKKYSYGCVLFFQDIKYTLSGSDNDSEYVFMRNVAGEILGCTTAVSWAIKNGAKKIEVYYDYEGIEKWAVGMWKANKKGTIRYREFISRASKDIEISFIKVAAHTGVKYNEEADRLAKAELGLA